MNKKITPQAATKAPGRFQHKRIAPQAASQTPGKFTKQIVQLDGWNLDDERAADKPHSRLFFRGGDILMQLEQRLQSAKPGLALRSFGPAFVVRIPVPEAAALLESIGFKQEQPGSNLYFRTAEA